MERAKELDGRYGIFRAARFGIAALVGFLVFEGMVVAGLYAIYGRADVQSSIWSSPALLGLDILALLTGVTVSFVVNEKTTVKDVLESDVKSGGALTRLAKFQAVSALGNAVVIGVQLLLLAALGLTPAVGSLVGAVAGYPVSYLVAMRAVWKT